MKTICLYFQVHQPMRLRRYRFFDMGKNHNYLDDAANRAAMQRVARRCYLPMNALLLRLIEEHKGAFRVSFSVSGSAVEQFRAYAPEVLESFQRLAATGHVEFLAGTYSHSLASLANPDEFRAEVERHVAMTRDEFGQSPTAFCNTELIYSDGIGAEVAAMGFKAMLAEGARHVLGWKSPNYLYASAIDQSLRLLLRNYKFSDDIAFRFSNRTWSEWPLTAEKYAHWLADDALAGEVVGLFMDYETFGERQPADSGIFDFVAALPRAVLGGKGAPVLEFSTVSEASVKYQPVAILHSPHAMSWADEERDITAWLGNELQSEAFSKLYALRDKLLELSSPDFYFPWSFLQNSDHYYYMATKWLSDGSAHAEGNPYSSAYDAFINYMNVLSDFTIELDRALSMRGIEKPESVCV
jgi:alpha-amylase